MAHVTPEEEAALTEVMRLLESQQVDTKLSGWLFKYCVPCYIPKLENMKAYMSHISVSYTYAE